jgi:hypothetical protein
MWANVTFLPTKQDKTIHVQSHRLANDLSSPSSSGKVPVSRLEPGDRTEWQGEMWARKRDIHANKTRQTRTDGQPNQQGKCSEFARNCTRELISTCSNNRMARKWCEQAWRHSCQQEKPIHVRTYSSVNSVSSPSSLGMEPVSRLPTVRTEWQGNVSKRDNIHTNKTRQTNQSTYGDSGKSM